MAHTPVNVKYKTLFSNGNDNGGEVQIQGTLSGLQTNPPADHFYQFVYTFTDSQNVASSQIQFFLTEKRIEDLIKQLQALVTP